MTDENKTETVGTMEHPSNIDALRHPADVRRYPLAEAVLQSAEQERGASEPDHVEGLAPQRGTHELDLLGRAVDRASHAIVKFQRELSESQRAYVASEAGAAAVREAVTVPVMLPVFEETIELRELLREAANAPKRWLEDLRPETIADVSHAAPGLHAAVMNVGAFAAQGLELLSRGTGRTEDWAKAFEQIVEAASKSKAWRLLAIASGALVAGPFTTSWDDAVEWCSAFWSEGA